jgi:hypothetical protein
VKGELSTLRKAGTRRFLDIYALVPKGKGNGSSDCQRAELNVPVAVASSTLSTFLAQRP